MRSLCVCLVLAACSSSHSAVDVDAAPDSPPDAPAAVAFRYAPAWSGVTSVSVVTSADWATPVALTAGGDGAFTGSVALPAGTYTYLFETIGDADAGGKADTLPHTALDPAAGYADAPTDAPNYSTMVNNPCSQLVVPTGDAPALYHVTGRVVVDAAPVAGWLVLLEREETGSHHYFVNRMTDRSRRQLRPRRVGRPLPGPDPASAVRGEDRRADRRRCRAHAARLISAASPSLPTCRCPTPRSASTTTRASRRGRPRRCDDVLVRQHGCAPDAPRCLRHRQPRRRQHHRRSLVRRRGDDRRAGSVHRHVRDLSRGRDRGRAWRTLLWGIEQARAGTIAWTAQTLVFPITWH